MTKELVINVYGGCVQDVFCSDPELEVTIVDWDVEGCCPEDDPFVVRDDRHDRMAAVVQAVVDPIERMEGTDVGRIVAVAKLRDLAEEGADASRG